MNNYKILNKRISILLYLLPFSYSISQFYFSEDPYYLMHYELNQFNGNLKHHSLSMRPFYSSNGKVKPISVKYTNNIYFNNNASNQENMDLRYIGKGFGSFSSIHISGYYKYFSFNIEPFILNNNYLNFEPYNRPQPFYYLNDAKTQKNIKDIGFRKAEAFLHYNGIGIGISNSNMWWGPGMHNSLAMSNNTTGFKHMIIGTIRELRWNKIGIMGKYVFSELNELSDWKAVYFTALTGQISIYNDQIFTIGFTRNFLTGGMDTGMIWTKDDAKKIIFEGFFIKNLQKLDYTIAGHDAWDQTITGWFEMSVPKAKMKIFLELGFNDNRFNFWDFVVHPDHSMASIVGFRKYGLLNNENIVFGFEYANLIKGRHHIFRLTPNWYERPHYKDFSYDGRRWAAHSGSDSDDLLIYFGFMNEKWRFVPSLNYERHGVTSYRPPEVKTEIRIDTRFNYWGFDFGLYYESQFEAHLGFPDDHYFYDEITGKRKTNTLILYIDKTIY